MDITKPMQAILSYMFKRRDEWVSPTTIGQEVGQKREVSASSWASSKLKGMANLGLVERNNSGKYKLSSAGVNAAETTDATEK